MIRALGWTTVLAPANIIQCDDNELERWYKVTENVARVKRNSVTDSDVSPDFTLNTNNSSGSNFSTGGGGNKIYYSVKE